MGTHAHLHDPIEIGTIQLKNRLYRAPVLEGAGVLDNPEKKAEEYARHFVPNAETGTGLIVQGNTVVYPSGNTAPGMCAVDGPEDLRAMKPMTDALHRHGCKIVLQLGHGGIYALPSWNVPARRAATRPMLAASPLPWHLRLGHPGVHVMSTEEVWQMIDRFGQCALWAREGGYDGIQLASANAKLIHQFLTPVYNRRDDAFGGSLPNRFRFVAEVRKAIARHAGEDFPVLLKIPMGEQPRMGKGITIDEGLEMCRMAEQEGFAAITPVIASHLPHSELCRGDFPAASYRSAQIVKRFDEALESRAKYWLMYAINRASSNRHPFSPVWNRDVFSRAKKRVRIPVFAVGGIRTSEDIRSILDNNEADMIGIGRPFYAEPDIARRYLAEAGHNAICANSNMCLPAQMLGFAGGCRNPEVMKRRAEQIKAQRRSLQAT